MPIICAPALGSVICINHQAFRFNETFTGWTHEKYPIESGAGFVFL
jgi:hypothetical protein